MNDSFIEINALGRECYLGQLYDAKTSTLLSGFPLYRADDVKPRKTDVNSTKMKYAEIKSFSDRAKSLDISAQISVSILGGLISISGGGSYLNSKQDTSESITIAMIAQYRTNSQSLDLVALEGRSAVSADTLARTRATHVVTSITYGGNVIGTLSQKSTNKSDTTAIKGNFSFEMLKGNPLFSISGKAELSMSDKETLNSFNLDVDLAADIKLGDRPVPTDPAGMLELVRQSSSFVGEGVPCEVRLTPLNMLISNVPSFRELAEADLIDIRTLYDKILKLENSRGWLRDAVEVNSEIFPTFANNIRLRTIEVTKLVQQARDKLRVYLEKYRGASPTSATADGAVQKPGEFIVAINSDFAAAIVQYENDKEEWRMYQDRLAVAEHHGFPVIGVSAVSSKMNRADKGTLAAILVPENANWEALLNLYGDLAVDIRQWRKSIDKAPDSDDTKGYVTDYASIYADPSRDATLYSLDDDANTLRDALKTARDTKRAVFLTYGRSRGHLGGFEWDLLNKDGWGVIVNKTQNWRYIGDVQFSKPYGEGVMTYVNKTKYAGSFVFGQRDGVGKILDDAGKEISGTSGIYIKNVLEAQGVMVEVTVVTKDGIPVQYGKVALNKPDSVRAHVDRIGTVMGWESQRLRLILNDGAARVDVVGAMIDSSEAANVESSSWPIGNAPKITARMLR